MKKNKKTKKKTKVKPKADKGYSFLQDWLIYPIITLVIVGMKPTVENLIREANKYKGKLHPKFIEELKDQGGAETISAAGLFFKTDHGSVLWLKGWNGTSWTQHSVLIHELHHAVHFVLHNDLHMENEVEGLAYAQGGLFDRITEKLNNPKERKLVF